MSNPTLPSAPAQRPPSVARIILRPRYRWLWLAELASGTAITAASTALALEVTHRTHNPGLVALIVALVAVPVLIVSPWVVRVVQHLGIHRSLVLTQLVTGVATLGAAVILRHASTDSAVIATGYCLVIIVGLMNAFHVPALFTSLSWFVGDRHVPQGISSFSARTVLTWILGPLLIAAVDGRWLMFVAGALVVLAALPFVALRPVFLEHEHAMRTAEAIDPGCAARALEEGVAEYDLRNVCMLSQAPATASAQRLRTLLAEPVHAFLIASYAVLYFLLGTFSIVLIPWATQNLGMSAAAAGSLLSLRAAAAMPGPLVAGRAVRRFGMSAVLVTAGIVAAAASLVAALQHRWGLLAACGVVVYGAVFYTLTTGTYTSLATVTFGRERRTEGAALFAFTRGVVSVLFVGVGLLARWTGVTPLLVGTVLASALMLAVFRFGTRRRWGALMDEFRRQQRLLADT